MIIRFKNIGGTAEQLLKVYELRIRSLLEFSAPVFHSSLTDEQDRKIEMVQKKALAIILGKQYKSYETSLTKLSLEKLSTRRDQLCFKFAQKCSKDPHHSNMFPLNNNFRENMRNPKKFLEYQCRTSRFFKSAIPFLSRLLNKKIISK